MSVMIGLSGRQMMGCLGLCMSGLELAYLHRVNLPELGNQTLSTYIRQVASVLPASTFDLRWWHTLASIVLTFFIKQPSW